MAILVFAGAAGPSLRAQATAATPKFEVASVKPCKADTGSGVRTGNFNGSSPGRLIANCMPLKALIQQAYLIFANGRYQFVNFLAVPVEGAPDWVQSARYTIEAKAEGPQTEEMTKGPMLQALLEDRFQLKTHRETREVPVYELTVAKGGPKLQPFDGSCTPVDFAKTPQLPTPPKAPGECRNVFGTSGPNSTSYYRGISVDDFATHRLGVGTVGRPVINKTGITGRFDIHLEFTPDRNADKPDAGPSIFTALQEQLGLKLIPAKGPGEFLVIDHVERPSEN